MSKSNIILPDVLRVTEYILTMCSLDKEFSVQYAANSTQLNGIGRHRIAQIMRDICLEPNGKGSLELYTTVDNTNVDNTPGRWQLNANAYFSYLSYLSLQESRKASELAYKSNKIALKTLRVAIATIVASILVPLIMA